MKNIVICCPEHKAVLTSQEELNVRVSESFNADIDKVFVLPKHISVDYYVNTFPTWRIIQVDSWHFSTNLSYNKFMLSSILYSKFLGYKFVLICQSDAVLVKSIQGMPQTYDYIGPVWNPPLEFRGLGLEVGNGGLSLRKVSVFYWLTRLLWFLKKSNTNEDVIFSFLARYKFLKVPSFEIADSIFKEETTNGLIDPDDSYGYHALEKWNEELQASINTSYHKARDLSN